MSGTTLLELDKRTDSFARNVLLDELLDELEALLGPVERQVESRFRAPDLPVVLGLGNPRCGSTLFMQVLAATGQLTVPTNLMSRFWYAPYLGVRIQQLLTDPRCDHKGELTSQDRPPADFSSALGKTRGRLAPNEFYHFWRRFTPTYDACWLDAQQREQVDVAGLAAALAAIEAAAGKPFAAKGYQLQFNLDLLAEAIPRPLFVWVRRHPFYVMQSILLARRSFYGRDDLWWSNRPREYAQLVEADPFTQIAGQVLYTRRALEEQLAELPRDNWMVVDYPRLCTDPAGVLAELRRALAVLGCILEEEQRHLPRFEPSRAMRLSPTEVDGLLSAWRSLGGEALDLSRG